MTQSASPIQPTVDGDGALATVRLEVRSGLGRQNVYEVGDGGFLIGSVPGCDLRLPGANLPPIICLIARGTMTASLRRLAPVLPILVNGKAVASAYLSDGDCVTIGPIEIVLSVQAGQGTPAEYTGEPQMTEQVEKQVAERAAWESRREEMEAEFQRKNEEVRQLAQRIHWQEEELAAARADLEEREKTWQQKRDDTQQKHAEIASLSEEARKNNEEGASVRRELAEIRQQLYQRYHERRERLIKQQQAIHKAARRLQQRKQRLDAGEEALAARQQEWESKHQEYEQNRMDVEGRAEQIARERQLLDEQHQLIVSRQQEVQRDLTERFNDVQTRAVKLVEAEATLEKGQKQHQADLVRLDRIQATLEQRQKQLQATALLVDRRYEQLQRDTRELEEQAATLDEWHNRLVSDTEQLAKQKQEQEVEQGQIEQRAAALEGQQAMLATLRTRLERMREELRKQEQALSDQRVLHEASETDLRTRLAETEKIRIEVDNDRQLQEEERRRFEERRATMEEAVLQLRQARDALDAEEKQLRQEQEQVRTAAADQAEHAALLTARWNQLEEEQDKLSKERDALRERELALVRAEQALAALQEQVRRRVAELNDKQRQQTEAEQRLGEETARLNEQAKNLDQDQQLADSRLSLARQELGTRATALDEQARNLAEAEEKLKVEQQKLDEAQGSLGGQRQLLASERIAFELERQKALEDANRLQAELEATRQEVLELGRTLPELEARGTASLDRLTQARDQLRDHLSEIHVYVKQSRGDMELVRREFQGEVERVRQQEMDLHVARDEHRLAVAAFRQQIAEWQGRLGEYKQSLQVDESRLERRASEVNEQAQQVADTSARLAQQAEQLQKQERRVSARRGEVDRHLGDMREWYRRKMRELAGVDVAEASEDDDAPTEGAERGILSLTGDVEPGDRQLGDLLRALELIDSDTLTTLLLEARRQRRSLRQLLLANNYLTLYQMALIEVGNLDGLVLGPVRVIDRLHATPREAVYRVFDPRRETEAVLRHLAESEMEDAVRPDEFRQQFAAAAAVRHANVAATLEVLELAGRPAVLQEWLHGMPSGDWPVLSGAPGVWCRLLTQAAEALHAIHAAGLTHGHLQPASVVFTRDGVLKLCGLGEPRWLAASPSDDEEPSVDGDLTSLGYAAALWAAVMPTVKGSKAKGLPIELQTILNRLLHTDAAKRYAGTAELLLDLERAAVAAPANPAAWERFVRQVRDGSTAAALRESA